ncbi:hypothetical protein BCR44DRAFT_1484339 [Catenaria anguillulae PL171]|uniref:SNF2 family N-terminal domain-domain-containing protein n=1 Tax=Catenaria anguillulae PL171 TaxID=765915 RepID=A0A1Y2HR67_9FUNG|nr:hypothetical protein BCR44DRAFT_1484339 [Catenaria anguillulae PL171]
MPPKRTLTRRGPAASAAAAAAAAATDPPTGTDDPVLTSPGSSAPASRDPSPPPAADTAPRRSTRARTTTATAAASSSSRKRNAPEPSSSDSDNDAAASDAQDNDDAQDDDAEYEKKPPKTKRARTAAKPAAKGKGKAKAGTAAATKGKGKAKGKKKDADDDDFAAEDEQTGDDWSEGDDDDGEDASFTRMAIDEMPTEDARDARGQQQSPQNQHQAGSGDAANASVTDFRTRIAAMEKTASAWWIKYPNYPRLHLPDQDGQQEAGDDQTEESSGLGIDSDDDEDEEGGDNQPDLFIGASKYHHLTRFPVPADGLNDEGVWTRDDLPILAEMTCHWEPVLLVHRPVRIRDDPERPESYRTDYDQYEVKAFRLPEVKQHTPWTKQLMNKHGKKPAFLNAVRADPYYTADEIGRRWFLSSYQSEKCNLWRVTDSTLAAAQEMVAADPQFNPETDSLADIVTIPSDGSHAISSELDERMLPYLRIVLRPVKGAKYTAFEAAQPTTAAGTNFNYNRETRFRHWEYQWCVYLRTAKANADLRKRTPGVTQTIRRILDMFQPGYGPMWQRVMSVEAELRKLRRHQAEEGGAATNGNGDDGEEDAMDVDAPAAAGSASSGSARNGATTSATTTDTEPDATTAAGAQDEDAAASAFDFDHIDELRIPEIHEQPLDHALQETPRGMKVTLHEYQRRILTWLKSYESDRDAQIVPIPDGGDELQYIRLGKRGMLYRPARCEMAESPDAWTRELPPLPRIACHGAIEASKVGSGKTITALSLIQAAPFRSVNELHVDPMDVGKFLPSRATLIVVRSDLTSQWMAEAAKAMPPGFKIKLLTTIHDYRDLSWNDVLTSDAVLVSTAFLQNANYRTRVAELVGEDKYSAQDVRGASTVSSFSQSMAEHVQDLLHMGRKRFGKRKGSVILERVFWHRIVVDELHEFVAPEELTRSEAYWRRYRNRRQDNTVNLSPAVKKLAADIRNFLYASRTRFILGLTGSPVLDTPEATERLLRLLQVRNIPPKVNLKVCMHSLLSRATRRANPDLQLPPVKYQTVWLHLTPTELGLAAAAMRRDRGTRLMALQHHQLLEEFQNLGHGGARMREDEVLTAAEISQRLQSVRQKQMENMTRRLQELGGLLETQKQSMGEKVQEWPATRRWVLGMGLKPEDLPQAVAAMGDSQVMGFSQTQGHGGGGGGGNAAARANQALLAVPEAERVLIRQRVAAFLDTRQLILRTTEELREISAQFNFMEAVLDTVKRQDLEPCPICFEDIEPGQELYLTHCGHTFCVPCGTQLKSSWQPRCAICRSAIENFTRMKIQSEDPTAAGEAEEDTDKANGSDDDDDGSDKSIDYSVYGTKVEALVKYTLRAVRKDKSAKLIMFVQFRRLATIISRAFTELGIVNVSLAGGNVLSKRKAVTAFKHDPNVRVIFLSYESSVSGLHLTEANYVCIVHPFLAEDEATSRAFELQGIARAVRAGQTREVTVVRFASRGTIEEDLTAARTMTEDEQVVEERD